MAGASRSQPGDQHARPRRTLDLTTATGRRVILVGRTGLESVLRGDAELEVTRVSTTFDAIGELSSPIDQDSPRDAVVIVGPDADPALRENAGKDAGLGMIEAEEFVRGLRRVQPLVRVLRVAEAGLSGVPYDGVISSRSDAAGAKRVILGLAAGGASGQSRVPGARGAAGPVNADRDDELDGGIARQIEGGAMGVPIAGAAGGPSYPTPRAAGAASGGAASDATSGTPASGDELLVQSVLQGREVLGPAIEIARARTGDATLVVTSAGGSSPGIGNGAGLGAGLDVSLPTAAGTVEVSDGVSVIGVLSGARVDPAMLRATGAWLSGWLKLARQQGELRRAAFTDALTGAWNRRYFERFLSAAIEQSAKARHQLSVLVFDIDDFKRFNERYGHMAADEVLVEVVRLLNSVIRPSDRVCRIGGDEFAVVFYEPGGPRNPGSKHPSSVQEIAARFQAQIRQKRFPKLGLDAPGTLTVSGGMSTFPWDGRSAEELLRHADLLALESKRQGKNAITLGPGGA
ncbi:MAG: GGDEF domain-containing protein [Phycisphaerales bacterium]|nr:GGDEF domain-containing protein [Phycisphaerales bacterium]